MVGTFQQVVAGEDLYEFMKRARLAVLAGQDQLEGLLTSSYRQLWDTAKFRSDSLLELVEGARAQGIEPTRNWLYQQERYKILAAELEASYRSFAQLGQQRTLGLARQAATTGVLTMMDATGKAIGPQTVGLGLSFAQPNTEAIVSSLIAAQSPAIWSLWEKYGVQSTRMATEALVNGVTFGHSARAIAAELRQVTGMNYLRAVTIARTETMRAYREGARAGMLGQEDVLLGWVWQCAQNKRTCAYCWGMQGHLFPYDKRFGGASAAQILSVPVQDAPSVGLRPMETHPNCRCALVPRAKSYGEILGDRTIPDNRPKITMGDDAFRKLPEDWQRSILGNRRYQMYKSGEIARLRDFATYRQSKLWGRTPIMYRLDQLGAGATKVVKAVKAAVEQPPSWRTSAPPEARYVETWKMAKALTAELEKLTGLKSNWNGRMAEWGRESPALAAYAHAGGQKNFIFLDDEFFTVPDWRQFQVLSHEIMHSISPKLHAAGRTQFTAMWEEAVTEGYTKTLRAELNRRTFRLQAGHRADIQGDWSLGDAFWSSANSPYDDAIRLLDNVRADLGMGQTAFWKGLYNVPANERRTLLEKWVRESIPSTYEGPLPHQFMGFEGALNGLASNQYYWMIEGRLSYISDVTEDALRLVYSSAAGRVDAATLHLMELYRALLAREVRGEAREFWGLEPDALDKRVESVARRAFDNLLASLR